MGALPDAGAYWRVLDIRQIDGHYEVDTMIILVEDDVLIFVTSPLERRSEIRHNI